MQIRAEVFAQLLTDRQTDKQQRKHNLLGGGNKNKSGMQCINKSSALAETGDRLATIDMGQKERAAVTHSGDGAGHHLSA